MIAGVLIGAAITLVSVSLGYAYGRNWIDRWLAKRKQVKP